MNGLRATLMRELRAYFLSPMAWVIATLFLLINGFVFWLLVTFLNDPRESMGMVAPLAMFFGQTVFFWLVLLIVAPVLTMRLLSEERKTGSIEVLMTSPVSETQVVLGKYFAALVFYAFLWVPTLAYVLIIRQYLGVDWGPVASGYLGVFGIGALFLAVGMFATSVARNQIVAAILSFAILMLLFCFGLLESLVNGEVLKKAFGYLDLWNHMEEFSKGIVDTRHLVYYVSATAFFLFLSARALAANKWR